MLAVGCTPRTIDRDSMPRIVAYASVAGDRVGALEAPASGVILQALIEPVAIHQIVQLGRRGRAS